MSIKPIDLQTLFMQLGQVGRDQAVEKEGAILQGAMKGAADQKRLDEQKEAVRLPEEPEKGAGRLRDRAGKGPGGEKGEGRGEGAEDGGKEGGGEVVTDPALGTRLDVTG